MGRKIQIRVNKQGGMSVDATGFKGGSCKEATKFLLEGKQTADENIKPEYYEEPEEREHETL